MLKLNCEKSSLNERFAKVKLHSHLYACIPVLGKTQHKCRRSEKNCEKYTCAHTGEGGKKYMITNKRKRGQTKGTGLTVLKLPFLDYASKTGGIKEEELGE